jgi:hypothetical protein
LLFLLNFTTRVQAIHKPIPLAGLALIALLSVATPIRAAENAAGDGTVAEWRTNLRRSELATAAYAAGVMAMGNVLVSCNTPRTAKDLHAYLVHRALPSLTMKQAIQIFLIEANCNVTSADRLISSDSSSKSINDAGEY